MEEETKRPEYAGPLKICGFEPESGRWILVLLGLIINLCLGSIYSWSVFVQPLTDYFTTTLGQSVTANDVLLPFSVFLAVFAITMPLSGKYIEKFGPRIMIIVGGLLTSIGWLLASLATSVQMLYVLYGIIGGIGIGIVAGVPVAVAARWFPDRRGLAVGLTALGSGFSALFTASIAGFFIGGYGVMNTFRIFGIAFIILLTLLAIPQTFPPEGWKPRGWIPPTLSAGKTRVCEFNRREMLRTRTFYGLWFCFFIASLSGLTAISIAKPVGTEVVGIEAGLATLLIGFFAIFNGGGRPLFGVLTDTLSPRYASVISFILIILASSLVCLMPTPVTYIVSFAVLWGCLGGWLAIAPTSTGSFFGTGDFPRCYGVLFLAYGAGAIVGPQLAGLIKTHTGSYLGVFPYVTLLAVLGIFVSLLLLKPVEKKNDERPGKES